MGWDLFGDPVYRQRQAGPLLPSYTSETLPAYLYTSKQIRAEGLEPSGPPVGILSWTPQGSYAPAQCPVWDIRKAIRTFDPDQDGLL
ncbi:hypothetical protein ACFUTR_35535 [Streptomyces sp. NPDC057367]|uniref:hypothetical protein n=1 Tax=Streptomyces sp. NPDC057367 TaxID=3346108 RepID=UPI0036381DD7